MTGESAQIASLSRRAFPKDCESVLLFRSVLVKFGLSGEALKGLGKGLEAVPRFKGF